MAQNLPDAPRQTHNQGGGGQGYSAAFGGFMAAYGGVEFGGDAYVSPGDGNNHTVQPGEVIIGADTSSSTATITLSDDLAGHEGAIVIINDEGNNAGTNNITVTAETDSSHNIDGSNQDLTISSNGGELRFYVDPDGHFWTW